MASLFQFPSEALIAAITSQRAPEEKARSMSVTSQTCTLFDKLLTVAKCCMMVIRQHAFPPTTILTFVPHLCRDSTCTPIPAIPRKTEHVCLPCARDCKRDSLQGFDQICAAARRGEEGGFLYRGQRKSTKPTKRLSSSCSGRLKCMDILFCSAFLPVNATQGLYMVG